MEYTKQILVICIIMVAITLYTAQARSINIPQESQQILSSIQTSENKPESSKIESNKVHTPCTGPLCHIARSYASPAAHDTKKEQQLLRHKRGDVDVKLAEYMQWWKIHGRPMNCEDVGCNMIEIINGRRRRSLNQGSDERQLL